MSTETDRIDKPMLLARVKGAEAPMTTGRREFFNYFDLGVKEATDGWMRAERIVSKKGLGQPTGWHYHTCTAQFVYQLSGWLDLVFEDGSVFHMEAGDVALIPGGCRHNEIGASDEFEALEISLPAAMGTVPCEEPVQGR